ncbi:hypothetical protein [Pollutibacter soli]|uniref:hypothetical protein n=1 Tax=Pollutibacter soli TaxID=3034157 RepID=UPI00301345AB
MNKLLIKIFRLLKPLFRKADPDFEKIMIILETKLTMDNRRVNMSWRNSNQKQNSNQLTRVLIIYTIFGLMIGFIVLFATDFKTIMVLFHSYVLFMMAMILVTDFSSVLLDTTDNQIILSKPVSSKTLFLARTFHIMVYLFQFTVAIGIGSWMFSFYRFGFITGVALIGTTFLTVLLAVFITYFLYLALMRFASEQKIREIISWFQIFMTILFSFSYQVLPRLVNFVDIRESISLQWYAYLLPPVWMAVSLEAIQNLQFDGTHLSMIALAVAVPIAGFWVLNKYLAPGFSSRLAALQQSTDTRKELTSNVTQKKNLAEKMSSWVNSNAIERAAFQLTWYITGRDRNFKMQFYPALGYLLVFFFIFLFKNQQSAAENLARLKDTSSYLGLIYLPVFLTSTAYSLLPYNEHFQASWIYHSTPLKKPGSVIIGAIKSVVVKYFIPAYLILFFISLWFWGGRILFDFVFGIFNNLFCFVIIIFFSEHFLPFSRQPATKQQAGRFARSLLQLLMIGILVGFHYLLLKHHWILMAMIPILFTGAWLILRSIGNLAWKKIAV